MLDEVFKVYCNEYKPLINTKQQTKQKPYRLLPYDCIEGFRLSRINGLKNKGFYRVPQKWDFLLHVSLCVLKRLC